MKTLVIYAHPDTPGHSKATLENVIKKLDEKKIEYDLIDLYKINYDPVLKEEEHYTTPGNRYVSEENKKYQQMIEKAKKIIFIYPIWWGGMPAILKGFIDRVFVAHFAFRYSKNGIPQRLLKGRKAAVFISSGGPKVFYSLLGGSVYKNLTRDVLFFCGIRSKAFHIGNAKKFNERQKKKVVKAVKKGIDWLY